MMTELSSRKMPLISALQGVEMENLQQTPMQDDSEPPLTETFINLLQNSMSNPKDDELDDGVDGMTSSPEMELLPLIDISRLWSSDQSGREGCVKEIAMAAKEWGFFQIKNHGIGEEVFENMKMEQEKVFRQPFRNKVEQGSADNNNNKLFKGGSYRWGNPRATCLRQLAWSEAIHVAISDIPVISNDTLRSAIQGFGKGMYLLAETLAEVLADGLGVRSDYFKENCPASSCYLRMNRYPSCPFASNVFGLMPHTDSDFLTILFQDKIGGLQLMKDDGCWINVIPNPNALVVNIGDLFQAWSNGVYKSVKHRVIASKGEARLSAALFYCPNGEAVIGSCSTTSPPVYTHFTFHEYRLQVHNDVQTTGDKVGLSRFLL